MCSKFFRAVGKLAIAFLFIILSALLVVPQNAKAASLSVSSSFAFVIQNGQWVTKTSFNAGDQIYFGLNTNQNIPSNTRIDFETTDSSQNKVSELSGYTIWTSSGYAKAGCGPWTIPASLKTGNYWLKASIGSSSATSVFYVTGSTQPQGKFYLNVKNSDDDSYSYLYFDVDGSGYNKYITVNSGSTVTSLDQTVSGNQNHTVTIKWTDPDDNKTYTKPLTKYIAKDARQEFYFEIDKHSTPQPAQGKLYLKVKNNDDDSYSYLYFDVDGSGYNKYITVNSGATVSSLEQTVTGNQNHTVTIKWTDPDDQKTYTKSLANYVSSNTSKEFYIEIDKHSAPTPAQGNLYLKVKNNDDDNYAGIQFDIDGGGYNKYITVTSGMVASSPDQTVSGNQNHTITIKWTDPDDNKTYTKPLTKYVAKDARTEFYLEIDKHSNTPTYGVDLVDLKYGEGGFKNGGISILGGYALASQENIILGRQVTNDGVRIIFKNKGDSKDRYTISPASWTTSVASTDVWLKVGNAWELYDQKTLSIAVDAQQTADFYVLLATHKAPAEQAVFQINIASTNNPATKLSFYVAYQILEPGNYWSEKSKTLWGNLTGLVDSTWNFLAGDSYRTMTDDEEVWYMRAMSAGDLALTATQAGTVAKLGAKVVFTGAKEYVVKEVALKKVLIEGANELRNKLAVEVLDVADKRLIKSALGNEAGKAFIGKIKDLGAEGQLRKMLALAYEGGKLSEMEIKQMITTLNKIQTSEGFGRFILCDGYKIGSITSESALKAVLGKVDDFKFALDAIDSAVKKELPGVVDFSKSLKLEAPLGSVGAGAIDAVITKSQGTIIYEFKNVAIDTVQKVADIEYGQIVKYQKYAVANGLNPFTTRIEYVARSISPAFESEIRRQTVDALTKAGFKVANPTNDIKLLITSGLASILVNNVSK